MRNWIERVTGHFKTNRAIAIDMTGTPTASLMPYLAALVVYRLKQPGAAEPSWG